MVYWKREHFWLGEVLEHPEIMTQGETLEKLEENLKDAFRDMALDEVPPDDQIKTDCHRPEQPHSRPPSRRVSMRACGGACVGLTRWLRQTL